VLCLADVRLEPSRIKGPLSSQRNICQNDLVGWNAEARRKASVAIHADCAV